MKQIVTKEPGRVEIEEVPAPKCGPGEVLLKLLFGGICGSDMGVYHGAMAGASYPRIPGHEYSAQIVETGGDVKGLEPGMIVTGNPYYNCGKCYSCRRGLVNCCTGNETNGVQRDGVFSQYIAVDAKRVYDGKGISPKLLAMVEPFCISYHGVRHAAIRPGEKVLVVGSGTIGVLAAVAALDAGAEVTLCDVTEEKLRVADAFGVHHKLVNGSPEQFEARVRELTDGNGYDVAVEAVGLPQTVKNCIDSVAFGGRVVLIGVVKRGTEFNFDVLRNNELKMYGSRNAVKSDFMEVMDIVRKNEYPLERLITNVFPFEEAPRAFETLDRELAKNYKVMLDFGR